jgi:hypothetical protein
VAVQNILVKKPFGDGGFIVDVYVGDDVATPDTITYDKRVYRVIVDERMRSHLGASEKTELGTVLFSDLVSAAFGMSTI